MDNITDWEVPVKQESLDKYLEYDNDIDDLFNETLLGLHDLDVPTGYVSELNHSQAPDATGPSFSYGKSHVKKHSRKISGSAIFGFDNHTRQLSLEFGPDLYKPEKDDKSISPTQLLRMQNNPSQVKVSTPIRSSPFRPDSIAEENNDHESDLIVTNVTPKSYKFPPSPPPPPRSDPPAVSYSAKYLQELGRLNSGMKQQTYTDDIEPILNSSPSKIVHPQHPPSTNYEPPRRYVPIPVQEPTPVDKKPSMYKQSQNTYLPPPSPPTLTTGSADHSSPEPHSFNSASPRNLNSSPVHENLFYNPQFYSDDNNLYHQQYSSPFNPVLSSSPAKSFYSPQRNAPTNDDSIDANATITQLTPLKNSQHPMTPLRNNMVLEWSPVVSPDAKTSKEMRQAIKQSSPRRRIKKTSLLPPGELDRYWSGPDDLKFFTCHYKGCGKKFTRRYNVRSHIQTHLSDRPFGCSYCPKRFVRQHDLNRHIKGHLEARHCRCECGKEFTRVDAMKKHKLRNVCAGGIAPQEEEEEFDQEANITNNLLDGLKKEIMSDDQLQ